MREAIERERAAFEADRKKRNRGLRPGGRKQRRSEEIVQMLADNAERCVNGGDFSFMRDARKARPKIDPDRLVIKHASKSTITRYLRAVREELIRRGHKL